MMGMKRRIPVRLIFLGYCGKCGEDVETDFCYKCGRYVQDSPHNKQKGETK